MKIPIRTNHTNNKQASLEKIEERETWLKLVVKIIRWKDGPLDVDKISSKEWNIYSKRLIKTNTTYSREKVLSELRQTKEIIERHGGFME